MLDMVVERPLDGTAWGRVRVLLQKAVEQDGVHELLRPVLNKPRYAEPKYVRARGHDGTHLFLGANGIASHECNEHC